MNQNVPNKKQKKQKRFEKVFKPRLVAPQLSQAKIEKRIANLIEKNENARTAKDEYLNTLLYPKDTPGSRVPSLLPIPSATARLQQTGSIAANASGFLKVMLLPGELGWAVHVWSASTDTDVSSGTPAAIGLGVMPVTSTVARLWRPVSAEIRVWSIANSNVGAGLYSMSTVTGYTHSSITFDYARDQADTVFGTHGAVFKGIYKPLDSTAMEFIGTSSSVPSSEYCFPVFCASGCAANQPFAYSCVVNYEYIPSAAYTDLIAVNNGPSSNPESTLARVLNRGVSIVSEFAQGAIGQGMAQFAGQALMNATPFGRVAKVASLAKQVLQVANQRKLII